MSGWCYHGFASRTGSVETGRTAGVHRLTDGFRCRVVDRLGVDAVIAAAGRGIRLGELTADRPKGLGDVAGRLPSPLAHLFETPIDTGSTS